MDTGMTAYVYARYSSANQREESIDAQLQAIREYCSRQDITIKHVYTDEAESARSDDRPEFQRLMEDLRIHPPNLVLVHKLDRFARNRYDSAFYRKKLKDHGVRLVSVLEPLDESPESVILESVLEGMAEYYSRNLAREVMKGLKQNAQKGKWNGGPPPFGYRITQEQSLAIEPSEAATVRRIFDLYLDGYGYKLIAGTLNEEGLLTATGGKWQQSSVRGILINERYSGTYVYGQRSSPTEKGKRNNHRYKSEEDIIRIPGAIPAIIEMEKWERVKKHMESRKRGPQTRQNAKIPYLLTGLIYCGECGHAYVGNGYTKSPKYRIYSCTQRKLKTCTNKPIRQTLVEEFVVSELKERIFADQAIEDLIPRLLSEMDKRGAGFAQEREAIRSKIKVAQDKISRLLDAIEEGTAGPDVKDRLNARRAEISDLREREVFLEEQANVRLNADSLRAYLLKFRESLDSGDPAKKRKTVETFVERVTVYSDHFDVYFRIDPVSDKVGGDEGSRTPVRKNFGNGVYQDIRRIDLISHRPGGGLNERPASFTIWRRSDHHKVSC